MWCTCVFRLYLIFRYNCFFLDYCLLLILFNANCWHLHNNSFGKNSSCLSHHMTFILRMLLLIICTPFLKLFTTTFRTAAHAMLRGSWTHVYSAYSTRTHGCPHLVNVALTRERVMSSLHSLLMIKRLLYCCTTWEWCSIILYSHFKYLLIDFPYK